MRNRDRTSGSGITKAAITLLVISFLNIVFWQQVIAYSSGPPDAATGAPGESTCGVAGCHGNLNTGDGAAGIIAPEDYLPGDSVLIDVVLEMTGQSRWGFEATVLDGSDEPVGTIVIVDSARTQLSTSFGNRQYVKHTTQGTDQGTVDQAPGWTFMWVAPEAGVGPVTFYVAGNAANGNFVNTGDFIYTAQTVVQEDQATDVFAGDDILLPERAQIESNYPNPFNPSTTIEFHLPRGGQVELAVYNTLGQFVRQLKSGFESPGMHSVVWSGANQSNQPVASGVYFVRLVTDNTVDIRKMVLTK